MSSSDSDEETVLRYGTPLEPYEEDEVPSKRKFLAGASSSQHATDAHGRRRFHGAFTGGFTAGHGNSVSTPEGWTPSTFKSSRAERGAVKARAPEDFMDEEDRGEFGIAPRLLQTQSDFSGQKRPHPGKRFHDGPIPGEPVLEQFVRVVPETAAVRLLRAMGWRPGQGVGERRARRAPSSKVYGCYVPPEFRQNTEEDGEDEESDGSDVDYEHLFAPEDYEPYLLGQKDDRFGLGYSGLSRRSVLGGLSGEYGADASAVSHLKMNDKGKKVSVRGQAFGVGALEEEDEDVYAGEDMSHYDFAIGGPRAPAAAAVGKDKKKSEGVEGFVRAVRAQAAARVHPPPPLPRDYTPAPAGFARTRFAADSSGQQPRNQGLGRHELSAAARGVLLGETAPTTLTSAASTPTTLSSAAAPEGDRFAITIPPPDAADAARAGVFRPFAGDPAKQARYERFVADGGAGGAGEVAGAGAGLAAWEAARELSEFQQAAKLYRPLTGVLRDRFTQGEQADDATNPLAGVERSRRGDVPAERRAAAEAGLHGALTRTRAEWRPDPLLCKRFNVPDPFGSRPNLKNKDKPKTSYSIFEYLEGSIHSKESFEKEQSQFSGSKSISQPRPPSLTSAVKTLILPPVKSFNELENAQETAPKLEGNKRMTVAEIFLMEAEKERLNITETENAATVQIIEKFDKIELYKSIFLSDSEEEDTNVKGINKSDSEFIETPKNIERNDSPPRGIFANLDFDKLNSWSSKSESIEKSDEKNKTKSRSTRWEKDNNMNNSTSLSPNSESCKIKDFKDSFDNTPSVECTQIPGKVVPYTDREGGVLGMSHTPERDNRAVDIAELFQSPQINEKDMYGPKIPEVLKKKIESSATELENAKIQGNASVSRIDYKELDIEEIFSGNAVDNLPRPMFRDKIARYKKEDEVLRVSSSSDSEAWVDVNVSKNKKQKKKKKSKKHKHKSKHKKKER